MVFCDALCEILAFPFLSCIFLHTVSSSAIPLLKYVNVSVWERWEISLPVALIYSSLYLISLSEPDSIHRASYAPFVGLVWEMKVVEISAQGLSVRSWTMWHNLIMFSALKALKTGKGRRWLCGGVNHHPDSGCVWRGRALCLSWIKYVFMKACKVETKD